MVLLKKEKSNCAVLWKKLQWVAIKVFYEACRTTDSNTLLLLRSTFFWIIQLQLVGMHAEYHTGIQHSEKRPNPSDENCIFSTLLYICDQVSKLRVEVPTVAFDQPLWKIVYRLGWFPTMTSFLGSIRNLMKDCCVEDLCIKVCWENTVNHIMSGKGISRA